MENAFYFILKFLFVLELFTFLYLLFVYVEKRLDKKAEVMFKIHYVTYWTTNDYYTHIALYPKRKRQSENKISSVNKI